nr:hypothetical protein CFP56_70433 [Quercus suber]
MYEAVVHTAAIPAADIDTLGITEHLRIMPVLVTIRSWRSILHVAGCERSRTSADLVSDWRYIRVREAQLELHVSCRASRSPQESSSTVMMSFSVIRNPGPNRF